MPEPDAILIRYAKALGSAEAAFAGIKAECGPLLPGRVFSDETAVNLLVERLSRIAGLVERANADIARILEKKP